ncbi:hypothetical protein [Flagellimonas myxillae]|uniref:hypothetical protein n=1 Tax=Flagellimonas myxillae TaxID=2942214 RepID=UPI00201EE216|nr:hypothetical protein [Muricauda myxillae]MCL6265079.1 hypothetical protein [Muricauda myxillae]
MKKLFLTACLLSSMFNYGQKKSFLSNNSFSGTFEMMGNKLKPGSIIIEKFKTSEGEFSGNHLKNEGIVFPYACLDCSFTIESTGVPIRVNETRGKGFTTIVAVVKKKVQKKQEALRFEELISAISSKTTLAQQRKVVYSAYPNFSSKSKIDDLAKRVELGEFLPNPVKQFIPEKEAAKQAIETESAENSTVKTDVLVNVEKPEAKERAKTENMEANPISETSEKSVKPPKIKTSKCQKNIDRLQKKLEQAKKTNDHLIINELQTALDRHLKKCE